jgi:hypothetical protein
LKKDLIQQKFFEVDVDENKTLDFEEFQVGERKREREREREREKEREKEKEREREREKW